MSFVRGTESFFPFHPTERKRLRVIRHNKLFGAMTFLLATILLLAAVFAFFILVQHSWTSPDDDWATALSPLLGVIAILIAILYFVGAGQYLAYAFREDTKS